jgi:hypothetical protein
METIAVLIEPAGLSDAPAILDLQKLAYQSEAALYDDYIIPPLMQRLESMQADFQRQTILKATLDRRIVFSLKNGGSNHSGASGEKNYLNNNAGSDSGDFQ